MPDIIIYLAVFALGFAGGTAFASLAAPASEPDIKSSHP
jgi:hypothetical protein